MCNMHANSIDKILGKDLEILILCTEWLLDVLEDCICYVTVVGVIDTYAFHSVDLCHFLRCLIVS